MQVDGDLEGDLPTEGDTMEVEESAPPAASTSVKGKDKAAAQTEQEKKSQKVVEALHKILRPFLLRRVKADVEKSLLPS